MTTTVPFGFTQTFPTFNTFGGFGAPTFPFAGFHPAFAGQTFGYGYPTGQATTTATIPTTGVTAVSGVNGVTGVNGVQSTPQAWNGNGTTDASVTATVPTHPFFGAAFGTSPAFPYGYTPTFTNGYTGGFTPGYTPTFTNGYTGGFTPGYTPSYAQGFGGFPTAFGAQTPWTGPATPFGWTPWTSTGWNSTGGVMPTWNSWSGGYPSFTQSQATFGAAGYGAFGGTPTFGTPGFTGYTGTQGFSNTTGFTPWTGAFTGTPTATTGSAPITPWSSTFPGASGWTPWSYQQNPFTGGWSNSVAPISAVTPFTPMTTATGQSFAPWMNPGYTGNVFAFPQAVTGMNPLGFSPYSWGPTTSAFYTPSFSNWNSPFGQFFPSPFGITGEAPCDRGQRRGIGIREAA